MDYSERFHESNEIHPTAIIHENVSMGKHNTIGAYAVIGGRGEVRDAGSFDGVVEIGDDNIISEFVTIHRPVKKESKTVIGNKNYIMVHTHISHDCIVGNNVEICGHSVLLGYASVSDNVRIKVGSLIRNRRMVGADAIVGMGSIVVKNVEPNSVVVGNPAKPLKKK